MKLTMKDVMTANCQIPHAEMLTSNHCAALARELNAMFEAPVPPAGDVEVLNAMFEFPMPPTVESVLRIAADGSRIRISADGSIYPVPPAGDAEESVADVVMFEGGKIIDGTLAYMETAVVGDRLYSTAHVTRLTAERDGLLEEVERLNELLAKEGRHFDAVWQKGLDLQSELTKARELLLVLREQGLNPVTAAAIRIFLAPQSAPAAKDGESGETICLLCFDKKTVPGPKHGDFVRDCPECCGEEG